MFKKILMLLGVTISFLGLSSFKSPQNESIYATTTPVTVNIGYTDYENFITKSEATDVNGNYTYSGYGVSLINRLNKITGWKVNFVYDDWEKLIGGTTTVPSTSSRLYKNDGVDLIMQTQKTDERVANYGFSTSPIGKEKGTLYTRFDDTSLFYGDYNYLDGKKIGAISGSYQNSAFKSFMDTNFQNINYTLIDNYKSVSSLLNDLEDKVVDTIILGSLSYESSLKVIGTFSNEPFYFMFRKDWEHKNVLNEALDSLNNTDPEFIDDLFSSFYGSITYNGQPNFTRTEIEYLNSIKGNTFNIALVPGLKPIMYDDNNTKRGILVDIMDAIAKNINIKINYSFMDETDNAINYIQKNENSLVLGAHVESSDYTDGSFIVSSSYLDTTLSFVTKEKDNLDFNSHLKIAVPMYRKGILNLIENNYPQYELITTKYENNDACLNALINGEVDAVIQNTYVVDYLLGNPHYESLKVAPALFSSEKFGLVSSASNENYYVLMSIFNKTRAIISDEKIESITMEYSSNVKYSENFGDFLYQYRVGVSLLFIAILLVVAFVFILFINQHRHQKAIEAKNKELIISAQKAQEANVAKSSFLSRMSHEIRTPLNNVIGLATLSKQKVKDDKSQSDIYKNLLQIEESSNMLLGIFNDILDVSAIEKNKIALNDNPFNMVDVVNFIKSSYSDLCAAKGIKYTVYSSISSYEVSGDYLRTTQILLNLISNSYKFTPRGGEIFVSMNEISTSNETALFEFVVMDNGSGMNDETIKKIFEPFEVTGSSSDNETGSGLGLSIVKNFVELMHGSIRIESEINKGTTFYIDIPFKKLSVSERDYEEYLQKFSNYKIIVIGDKEYEYIEVVNALKRIKINNSVYIDLYHLNEIEHKDNEIYIVNFDSFPKDKLPELLEGLGAERIVGLVDNGNEMGYKLISNFGIVNVITRPLSDNNLFNALKNVIRLFNKEEETLHDFSKYRALVVEDNSINLDIVCEYLRNLQFKNIIRAENGKEAVDKFVDSTEGYFDIILMDIQLPVMDGLVASDTIRALGRKDAKSVIILAMTGKTDPEDIANTKRNGMNGSLIKPFDIHALNDEILKYIK
jgi:signal transduction histidine kinase/CheY-like chemotaxis protein